MSTASSAMAAASTAVRQAFVVVRTAGIEPARASPRDFKSLASTSFATSASLCHLTADWSFLPVRVVPQVQAPRVGQEDLQGRVHPVVPEVLPVPAPLAVRRAPAGLEARLAPVLPPHQQIRQSPEHLGHPSALPGQQGHSRGSPHCGSPPLP